MTRSEKANSKDTIRAIPMQGEHQASQQPITDDEARRLAKSLALYIHRPIRVLAWTIAEGPITIADMIRTGGLLLGTSNEGFRNFTLKESNREFLSKVFESLETPELLEDYLYSLIKERSEAVGDINTAISEVEDLLKGPGTARAFLKKAFTDMLPKGRRGRPSEYNPATDPQRFLSVSTALERTCMQFLDLREKFPNKSLREIMDFIGSEASENAMMMRKHTAHIDQTLRDADFELLKTPRIRARSLADAITGKELFDWSYVYASQRAGEFRRTRGDDSE